MSFPHIFGGLAGLVPASYLDDNFNVCALASDLATTNAAITALQTGNWTVAKQLLLTGEVAPTGISGVVNDYNPTNLANAGVLRLTLSAAATLTGLAGGVAGRILVLANPNPYPLTLLSASTASSAANRFGFAAGVTSFTVAPYGGRVMLQYDGTSSTWRVFTLAVREVLFADRTYFVSTTGNDSNDGLTASTPLLTVQAAVNLAFKLDFNGYVVTIQIADGTYAGGVAIPPIVGGGSGLPNLIIQGNTTTPSNVVFSNNVSSVFTAGHLGRARLRGVKFSGAGVEHIRVERCGEICFDLVEFGATTAFHCVAYNGGILRAIGNYTISGGAAAHWRTTFAGEIICAGFTVTLTGTPAFTNFANATLGGVMQLNGNVFSGSATGTRYTVDNGGGIYTNGAGATYLPGNSAGTTTSPGWYA